MLRVAVGVNHQPIISTGGEADAADRRLVAKLVKRDTRQIIIKGKHHLTTGAVHALRVTQDQRNIRLRFTGEVLARRKSHVASAHQRSAVDADKPCRF